MVVSGKRLIPFSTPPLHLFGIRNVWLWICVNALTHICQCWLRHGHHRRQRTMYPDHLAAKECVCDCLPCECGILAYSSSRPIFRVIFITFNKIEYTAQFTLFFCFLLLFISVCIENGNIGINDHDQIICICTNKREGVRCAAVHYCIHANRNWTHEQRATTRHNSLSPIQSICVGITHSIYHCAWRSAAHLIQHWNCLVGFNCKNVEFAQWCGHCTIEYRMLNKTYIYIYKCIPSYMNEEEKKKLRLYRF